MSSKTSLELYPKMSMAGRSRSYIIAGHRLVVVYHGEDLQPSCQDLNLTFKASLRHLRTGALSGQGRTSLVGVSEDTTFNIRNGKCSFISFDKRSDW